MAAAGDYISTATGALPVPSRNALLVKAGPIEATRDVCQIAPVGDREEVARPAIRGPIAATRNVFQTGDVASDMAAVDAIVRLGMHGPIDHERNVCPIAGDKQKDPQTTLRGFVIRSGMCCDTHPSEKPSMSHSSEERGECHDDYRANSDVAPAQASLAELAAIHHQGRT